MVAHLTSARVAESIDEIEAVANGEMDFGTEDTEKFFASPRLGAKIVTPNGSTIRVKNVYGLELSECDGDMWLRVRGEVLSAPQCPQYTGQLVTFRLKRDGSVCFAENS